MTRIAPILRQKCSQGLGLAVLFSLSRRDFITFICNEFLTQDTSAPLTAGHRAGAMKKRASVLPLARFFIAGIMLRHGRQ
ncbi:hypothetical protein D3870_13520 [Noviherbaspirillum cavernae]|uniref:Uncharacterized protein n=1 Tax=Noviherbaspirillum cavernae TaxID=2320862 RepID=A0A418X3B6_9BURK|nr:hypothetical protein D3870_13520 [Noviherbaspirillum cavernae]